MVAMKLQQRAVRREQAHVFIKVGEDCKEHRLGEWDLGLQRRQERIINVLKN